MQKKSTCSPRTTVYGWIVVTVVLSLGAQMVWAQTTECRPCCQSAAAALKADVAQAQQDYWLTIANCHNLLENGEKRQCRLDAADALLDAMSFADAQNAARLKICRLIGDQAYRPVIEPNDFVNFGAIVAGDETLTPNPFQPLVPGTVWEYMAFDAQGAAIETSRVEVLNQTILIEDVNCIVVRDQVWELDEENEILVEDTLDFFAQDREGNVWYFGEDSQSFEDGRLVSLEGSWRAGENGALPGIVMLADPQPGDVYRQEFLIGEAEDVARVVTRGESEITVVFGTFTQDVLRTREWSPLEPDLFEIKFYAPDTGLILENNPNEGERVELIDMTVPGE